MRRVGNRVGQVGWKIEKPTHKRQFGVVMTSTSMHIQRPGPQSRLRKDDYI